MVPRAVHLGPAPVEPLFDGFGQELAARRGLIMILLRRGLRTQTLESSFELDVMLDLGQQSTRSLRQRSAPWRPPIDVFETDNGLVVRAELGGLTASEVEVLVSGDELILRGERDVDRRVGPRVYHESRVRYGRFEAAVRLPFRVEVESATAEYRNGFLSVELPRLAATGIDGW